MKYRRMLADQVQYLLFPPSLDGVFCDERLERFYFMTESSLPGSVYVSTSLRVSQKVGAPTMHAACLSMPHLRLENISGFFPLHDTETIVGQCDVGFPFDVVSEGVLSIDAIP